MHDPHLALLRAHILDPHPYPHPNTPHAATCLHLLHTAPRRDSAATLGCALHCLAQRQHPAPEAWLLEAALYRLCCALAHTPRHTSCACAALTALALLTSAHDRLGHPWTVARADARGAALHARTHLAPGRYTPRTAPHQHPNHAPPTLTLRWTARGVAWLHTDLQGRTRGGLLNPDTRGAINPMPLVAALLGWEPHHSHALTRAVLRWESASHDDDTPAAARITHARGSRWCDALA